MVSGKKRSYLETVLNSTSQRYSDERHGHQDEEHPKRRLIRDFSRSDTSQVTAVPINHEADFNTAEILASLKFGLGCTNDATSMESSAPVPPSRTPTSASAGPAKISSLLCSQDEVQSDLTVFELSSPSTEPKQDDSHRSECCKSESQSHVCTWCGTAFERVTYLRLHIKSDHPHKKPYRCEEPACNAAFSHYSSKIRHWRTVHLKLRNYHCSYCNLSFGEMSGLRKHELAIHERSRPHQCSLCGFKFSFKLHLQQHITTVHEKKRPFACDVCGMAFGQRSSLNRHMRKVCRKDSGGS